MGDGLETSCSPVFDRALRVQIGNPADLCKGEKSGTIPLIPSIGFADA
jgi:hypothetical protein